MTLRNDPGRRSVLVATVQAVHAQAVAGEAVAQHVAGPATVVVDKAPSDAGAEAGGVAAGVDERLLQELWTVRRTADCG
jgi:hypothetical protein